MLPITYIRYKSSKETFLDAIVLHVLQKYDVVNFIKRLFKIGIKCIHSLKSFKQKCTVEGKVTIFFKERFFTNPCWFGIMYLLTNVYEDLCTNLSNTFDKTDKTEIER